MAALETHPLLYAVLANAVSKATGCPLSILAWCETEEELMRWFVPDQQTMADVENYVRASFEGL